MAVGSSRAVTIPMIILGLCTAYLLFCELPSDLSAGCPHIVKHGFRSGNEELDRFLCAMVQFFKFPLRTSEGLWIMGYLLTTALSAIAFMAVEGSRYGSSWLLSFTPVYLFLGQVAGISVAVPLVWLPVYFISNAAASKSVEQMPARGISPWRAFSIKFVLLFLELNIVAMLVPFGKLNSDMIYLLFQPAPVLAATLWLLLGTTRAADFQLGHGHKAVMLVHALEAGFGLVWHLGAVLLLLEDPSIPGKLLQVLSQHPGNLWCTYFVMLDFLVLFVALVYVSAVEDGILAAASVILAACAVGPAAAISFYFCYREHKIFQENAAKHKED